MWRFVPSGELCRLLPVSVCISYACISGKVIFDIRGKYGRSCGRIAGMDANLRSADWEKCAKMWGQDYPVSELLCIGVSYWLGGFV